MNLASIRQWSFVIIGTVAFLLLDMLIRHIFQNDFGRLFRCIRNVLVVCFFISICIWITKMIFTKNFEMDFTLGVVLFVLLFMIINYLIYLILKIENKRPIYSRSYLYHSGEPRFKTELFKNTLIEGRLWLLTTISLLGAPVFICLDVWYLITTYLKK